jgi:hypothetical protein
MATVSQAWRLGIGPWPHKTAPALPRFPQRRFSRSRGPAPLRRQSLRGHSKTNAWVHPFPNNKRLLRNRRLLRRRTRSGRSRSTWFRSCGRSGRRRCTWFRSCGRRGRRRRARRRRGFCTRRRRFFFAFFALTLLRIPITFALRRAVCLIQPFANGISLGFFG